MSMVSPRCPHHCSDTDAAAEDATCCTVRNTLVCVLLIRTKKNQEQVSPN